MATATNPSCARAPGLPTSEMPLRQMMEQDATASYADGKIKAELGDDPEKEGEYSFSFTVNNLSGRAQSYTMRGDFFTQDLFEDLGYTWLDTQTAALAAQCDLYGGWQGVQAVLQAGL